MSDYDLVIRGGTIADGSGGELFDGDIAVKDGRIAGLGDVTGRGAEEIDAKGRIVTPGFVDVHTHYDGQAIWSDRLAPSSAHGVTTVVMGNCGVGFAPCRAGDRDLLVRVMEGVEDIPGVVMTEGLKWDWESFPQYLDRLEAGERDIDVAAYLPHSPLRVFVMGERGAWREPATQDDLGQMRALSKQAMEAGALGFATSRLNIHRTADGDQIPSYDADSAELKAICAGMTDAGTGTLQIVLDAYRGWDDEFDIMADVVRACGRPATYTLACGNEGPPTWRGAIAKMEAANAAGASITAQVMPRPIGLIAGLELSVQPFGLCPSYRRISHLPLAERIEAMRDPELRRAITTETPDPGHPLAALGRSWAWMFLMDDPPNYEPPLDSSVAVMARTRGCTPEELVYDSFVESEGNAMFLATLGNFENGKLDAAHEMLTHPDCVPGLGDGGAHYGAICDASYSTFLLSHWVRDAKERRIELAQAVHMLTAKTARAVGLNDRGVLKVGAKADINLIDLDRLRLHRPEIVRDLPAGGRRLDQRATGYDATIVSGQVIRRFGKPTEALPGKLVRGAQAA